MSICDSCIHDDVCGLEDNHEEGIVSCADRIPKDILDKIRAEIDMLSDSECNGTTITIYSWNGMKRKVFEILNKYKAESEEK